MTPERLMAAYAQGDARAFERLFDAVAPRIRWFFLRSFRDEAVADDLTQQVFLLVHRARHEYEPGAALGPWLFTIAGRVRRDELRRRTRKPVAPLPEGWDAPDEREPADGALDRARRAERIRAALDELPEPQRLVIHLHRFEGLGFAEIGEALGCSAMAARLRAFRGDEKLRKVLGSMEVAA